jgi:hypothetical protein
LDVDGTLLEFTDSPLETHADPELKALLTEVAERLGGAAGLHGVERRKASGAMHGAIFLDSHLDRARTVLQALV